jgi:hypothetical protein
MKSTTLFVFATFMLVLASPVAVTAQPSKSVSKAALVEAGRRATLKLIDYGNDYCDGAITVEEWLKALVGKQARSTSWTGGQCVLVNDLRPGIDASSWPYCAQATVALVHPKDKDDTPIIEIYFEKPVQGRPGAAYAFRGVMETRDDGPDYIRFRKDFEAVWDERFPPDPAMQRCRND